MSSNYKTLGHLDVDAFLRGRNGTIHFNLIDAGKIRLVSQKYEWETDTTVRRVLLRPIRSHQSQAKGGDILIPQFINLTPETIAFMGAYDGDGHKTDKIAFSQNNPQLQDFVSRGLQVLFPDAFDSEVAILADETDFLTDDIIDQTRIIKQEWTDQGRQEDQITQRELQEEVLQRKYNSQYDGEPPDEPTKFVISAKKGGYEIIRTQLKSEHFLPFLLAIIKTSVNSILQDSIESEEITWVGPPAHFSPTIPSSEVLRRKWQVLLCNTGRKEKSI